MINEDTVQSLIQLGIRNYRHKTQPDCFAAHAAILVASDAASQYSTEASDTSVFLAVINSLSTVLNFSAETSITALKTQELSKKYFGNSRNSRDPDISNLLQELANKLEFNDIKRNADTLFRDSFDEGAKGKQSKAKIAAATLWLHTYTVTRSSYIYSMVLASRYPEPERELIFKKALSKRLHSEISGEIIEPSFFIKVISSDATQYISVGLLVIGALLLTLGILALSIPTFGAVIGISGTALITTGAAGAFIGGSLYAGGFFARKQQDADKRQTQDEIERINSQTGTSLSELG